MSRIDEAEAKLALWIKRANLAFGSNLSPDDTSLYLTTPKGIDIMASPAPFDATMFFTAMFTQKADELHLLKRLLDRNLFQSTTNGGWFAVDPTRDVVCWQFRWDQYPTAEFEEFLAAMEAFMTRAEQIQAELEVDARAASNRTSHPEPETPNMIRI